LSTVTVNGQTCSHPITLIGDSCDLDGDGYINILDDDDDNDGILDLLEGMSNCPSSEANQFGVEEDVLQAAFHNQIVKINGGFMVCGPNAGANGVAAQLYFVDITAANGYTYVGSPVHATLGLRANSSQNFLMTDSNKIYVWGTQGGVLPASVAASGAFAEPASWGLPSGVTTADVKMFKATGSNIGILTHSGDLYLAGASFRVLQTGPSNGTWTKMKTDATTALPAVEDFDIVYESAVAKLANDSLITWGFNVFRGNGTGDSDETWPVGVVNPLPAGVNIVQIELGKQINRECTYYILGSDHIVYVLGDNVNAQLGNGILPGPMAEITTWTNPVDTSGTGVLGNVKYIAPNDNAGGSTGLILPVTALLNDGTFINWGSSNSNMLGRNGVTGFHPTPAIPIGTETSKYITCDGGGHICPMINDAGQICNAGHFINGSFGNGSGASGARAVVGYDSMPGGDMVCSGGSLDYDGDGIFNHQDLDSDNDGCPDALEGGDAFNLVSINSGMLSGGVYANGVPTVVDSAGGQSLGTSQDSIMKSDQCIPMASIIDHNTIFQDSTATGNIIVNDQGVGMRITSIDGATITSTGSTVTTDKGGILTIDSAGEYSYVPASGFLGIDSIVYTVCNENTPPECLDEYLIIEVLPLLNPVVTLNNSIVGNGDKLITLGDTVGLNLLTNDGDPEGDNLSFQGVEDPSNPGAYLSSGTLSTVPGVDSAGNSVADAGDLIINPDGSVEFVPLAGFVGDVSLTYQICDDGRPQACTDELLEIQVLDTVGSAASSSGENPPFANGDFSATDINTSIDGNFVGNDGDPDDNDALSVKRCSNRPFRSSYSNRYIDYSQWRNSGNER